MNATTHNAKAWFCPSCGSADITASTLAGGAASCNSCSWKGQVEDLPAFYFNHDLGSPEEVFRTFFNDVRKVLTGAFATVVGRLLIKWGFLDRPTPDNHTEVTRQFARYMNAVSLKVVTAIVEERQKLEKEKLSGRDPEAD